MTILFNNCRGRDHEGLYGSGAFFDLETSDRSGHLADSLVAGSECVVASHGESGNLNFTWFVFTHEVLLPDEDGCSTRVFFGVPLRSEVVASSKVRENEPYSIMFTKHGHFKRVAVRRHPS